MPDHLAKPGAYDGTPCDQEDAELEHMDILEAIELDSTFKEQVFESVKNQFLRQFGVVFEELRPLGLQNQIRHQNLFPMHLS